MRSFVATQTDLKEEFNRAVEKHPDGNIPKEQRGRLLRKVPIVAAMEIGFDQAEKDGYEFRVFAREARNKNNKATETELEIIKRFENNTSMQEIQDIQKDHIVIYRPVHLLEKQGCLLCHGHPSTSPWGNGKDILGHDMENWSDGKIHGVFEVRCLY